MDDAAHSVSVETLLTHRGWVRALAWSLVRDVHLVDEIEQETWLRALRSPPRQSTAARGWLGVVVRNVVRNRFRSVSRRTAREDAAPPRTASPAAADVVARADAQQGVVRAVMALEEPYRTTLLLRFFDDLPPRDVAARMEVPVETVRTRTRRALARVRDDLTDAAGGRRAAFALLAPLLAEGPPPLPTAPPVVTTAASSMATTTGALVMAITTKKLIATAAAVVVLAALGAAWVVQQDPANGDVPVEVAATSPSDEAAATVGAEPGRRRVKSTPVADGEASAATDEVAVQTTRVRVLLPDGEMARGVQFGGLPGASAGGHTVRVADDVLHVQGTGTVEISLTVAGRPAHVARVELTGEDVDVQLPDGGVVEGIVRVDGAPPTEPITLRLSGAAPEGSSADPELVTDHNGAFRFAGLSDVSEARMVVVDRGHDFVEGEGPFLDVAVPSRGLILDLLARPRAWGRVVWPDGTGVAAASLSLVWSGPHGSGSMGREAGAAGHFDFPLPGHEFTELVLTASAPGAIASTTVTPRSAPEPGGALGDIVLPALREVELLIVDAAGEPVSGASVLVGSAEGAADSAGRVVVAVSESEQEVHVGAIGFEATSRELTQGLAEPVRVPLAAAASVVLALHPAQHDVPSLRVRVIARGEPMFAGEHGASPSDVDLVAGASSPGAWRSGELPDGTPASVGWFSPDESGRVVLNGVHPDGEFEAALIDGMGAVHDRVTVRPSAGTAAPQMLRVRLAARTVAGVVLDSAGAPLARARVVVAASNAAGSGTANGAGTVTRTDDEGRFRVGRVFADAVEVLVTTEFTPGAASHVPWSRGGIEIGKAAELDVRLVKGVTVRLNVTDEAGQPVVSDHGFADIDLPFDGNAFLWYLEPVEGKEGTYEIAGLPKDGGPVTVEIQVDDETGTDVHRVQIDPAAGDQDVVLGAPAYRENNETE